MARKGIDGNQCFTPPKCGTSGWLMMAMEVAACKSTITSTQEAGGAHARARAQTDASARARCSWVGRSRDPL